MKTKILLLALGLLLPTVGSGADDQYILPGTFVDNGFVYFEHARDGKYELFKYIGDASDVVIPDSVYILSTVVFWERHNVKTITIPSSVKGIDGGGYGAISFQFCDSLAAFYVAEDSPAWYAEDGVLFSKDRKTIVMYPKEKKSEEYVLPASVIKSWFKNDWVSYGENPYLKRLTIPAGASCVPQSGFPNLESIEVDADNETYSSIDGVVYSKEMDELICCPSGRTKPLVIPKTVTKLDVSKLFGCTRLSGISVEEGGHFIVKNDILYSGDETRLLFCARGKNGSVTDLPATLRSVDARAFANCTLLRDIALPTVEEIGPDAFSGCVRLAMVDMPKAGIIGERAFENCTALSIVTLPPTGRSIGTAAFKNSGVSSIIVPDGVSVIEESVFDGCSNLIQVVFPASLDTIKDCAFQNTSLVRFTIPGSVKDIRQLAFGYCPNLREVTVEWPVPLKSVSGNAFLGVANSRVRLRVPLGSKSGYEAMFPWRTFVIDEYELPSFIPDGILDAEDISIYSASGAEGLVIRLREGIDLQRVQLFDFSGRQVYSGTSVEIDRSELGLVGPGSFILRIETTHGLYVGKVVL